MNNAIVNPASLRPIWSPVDTAELVALAAQHEAIPASRDDEAVSR